MFFLIIIFLSYSLGCITTIAFSLWLFLYNGFHLSEPIDEQEQYQNFHPLTTVNLKKKCHLSFNYI